MCYHLSWSSTASTRQHIIVTSVLKFGASFLTRHLASSKAGKSFVKYNIRGPGCIILIVCEISVNVKWYMIYNIYHYILICTNININCLWSIFIQISTCPASLFHYLWPRNRKLNTFSAYLSQVCCIRVHNNFILWSSVIFPSIATFQYRA
jgi:hypothetical protein